MKRLGVFRFLFPGVPSTETERSVVWLLFCSIQLRVALRPTPTGRGAAETCSRRTRVTAVYGTDPFRAHPRATHMLQRV